MELYLHIGTIKTGTTSIQAAFHANRKALVEKGIFYPNEPNHILMSLKFSRDLNRVNFFTQQGLTETEIKDLADRYVMQTFSNLDSGEYRKAIFSTEDFHSLPRESVYELKKYLEQHFDVIKVVCYLRNPVDFAISHLQSRIKRGSISLEEGPKTLSFSRIIGHYAECFGKENLILREFDKRLLVNGDAVADFVEAIGEPADLLPLIPDQRKNESLSLEAVLIANTLYKKHPIVNKGKWNPALSKRVNHSLLGIPGVKFSLKAEQIEEVIKCWKDEVAWLREFTGRNFFADMESQATGQEATEPKWSDETLLGIAETINGLMIENERLLKRLKKHEEQ